MIGTWESSEARPQLLLAALLTGLLLGPDAARGLGGQWGLEMAIDAPWRVEPIEVDGKLTYGPIPIVIAFHDAVFDTYRRPLSQKLLPRLNVGILKGVEVTEIDASGESFTKTFTAAELDEIEATTDIPTTPGEPEHHVCQPARGQTCKAVAWNISESHAWHGMLWYAPRNLRPGDNLRLEVKVVTQHQGRDRWWINRLVVHAGEAPLPRFSNDWIYGDLHYHAQLSDNEGESAYSYRNVARALGAMGMDFVFATDHASSGVQTDGRFTGRRCSVTRKQCDDDGDCLEGESCRLEKLTEARDLNGPRFAAAKGLIYGDAGSNEAIAEDARDKRLANYRSRRVLPQVFLGEEVDVAPEISAQEHLDGRLIWGDGRVYEWANVGSCVSEDGLDACRKRWSDPHPVELRCTGPLEPVNKWRRGCSLSRYPENAPCRREDGLQKCVDSIPVGNTLALTANEIRRPLTIKRRMTLRRGARGDSGDPSSLIPIMRAVKLDNQGAPVEELADDYIPMDRVANALGKAGAALVEITGNPTTEPRPSRQHIVYFPFDTGPTQAGWVPSDSGVTGGGGYVIGDVVSEIERAKGRAFLAHPTIGPRPPTGDTAGPDMVPYSRIALDQAWASHAILGLQFWNEDDRRRVPQKLPDHVRRLTKSPVLAAHTADPTGQRTVYTYGLPFGFGQLNGIRDRPSWRHWPLPAGDPEEMLGLARHLYHGAYTWDVYLRKGLDPDLTRDLRWLRAGEPRKWYMAGGSDAHGDLNFRRAGRPDYQDPSVDWSKVDIDVSLVGIQVRLPDVESPILQWTDAPAVDTAIGKPRNLVLVGPPKGPRARALDAPRYTNIQVLQALEAGRFSVTDGPALRIAIDRNGNGRIDVGDDPMGSTVSVRAGQSLPLLVEWYSTKEFGALERFDVYVGTIRETFAPVGHGPAYDDDPDVVPRFTGSQSYAADPTNQLRFSPGQGEGYRGTRVIALRPERFGVPRYGGMLYVRVFAKGVPASRCLTSAKKFGVCGDRYAYTNPIWAVHQ